MTNLIKYSTSSIPGTLSKGDFSIGINDYLDYPGNHYHVGITPPSPGYTVYNITSSNIPNIYCGNDTDLMHYAVNLGAVGISTVNDALNFFNSQTNMMVVNMDYPNITTDGLIYHSDAGYTPSYPKNGTTLYDVSGNGLTPSLLNSTGFESTFGSLTFNGTNQLVQGPNAVNTGQNFSVVVWFYNQVTSSGRGGLVSNAYNYSSNSGFYFYIRSGWGLTMDVGQDQAYLVSANNTFAANTWYCAAATVTNGGIAINMWVNGIQLTSFALTNLNVVSVSYTNYNQFNLGVLTASDYFTGNIAIVQLYNKVLTATEVAQNWNANRSRFGL